MASQNNLRNLGNAVDMLKLILENSRTDVSRRSLSDSAYEDAFKKILREDFLIDWDSNSATQTSMSPTAPTQTSPLQSMELLKNMNSQVNNLMSLLEKEKAARIKAEKEADRLRVQLKALQEKSEARVSSSIADDSEMRNFGNLGFAGVQVGYTTSQNQPKQEAHNHTNNNNNKEDDLMTMLKLMLELKTERDQPAQAEGNGDMSNVSKKKKKIMYDDDPAWFPGSWSSTDQFEYNKCNIGGGVEKLSEKHLNNDPLLGMPSQQQRPSNPIKTTTLPSDQRMNDLGGINLPDKMRADIVKTIKEKTSLDAQAKQGMAKVTKKKKVAKSGRQDSGNSNSDEEISPVNQMLWELSRIRSIKSPAAGEGGNQQQEQQQLKQKQQQQEQQQLKQKQQQQEQQQLKQKQQQQEQQKQKQQQQEQQKQKQQQQEQQKQKQQQQEQQKQQQQELLQLKQKQEQQKQKQQQQELLQLKQKQQQQQEGSKKKKDKKEEGQGTFSEMKFPTVKDVNSGVVSLDQTVVGVVMVAKVDESTTVTEVPKVVNDMLLFHCKYPNGRLIQIGNID